MSFKNVFIKPKDMRKRVITMAKNEAKKLSLSKKETRELINYWLIYLGV